MTPEQVAFMRRMDAPNFAALLRIVRPSVIDRLWTGPGKLPTPADDEIDPSAIYIGTGILRQLPELTGTPNGTAARVEITFSGVDVLPRSYMQPGSDVLNAPIQIGTVDFDHDLQIDGAIQWDWLGKVDVVRSSYEDGVKTITLSCISGSATRAGSKVTHWTPAQHMKRNPTDTAFKMVPGMTMLRYLKW